MADGDREAALGGRVVTYTGRDWPIPGTRWTSLALSPDRAGGARSLNDGSLVLKRPAAPARQSYPAVPSLTTNSDLPNTAAIGPGVNTLGSALPPLTDMTLAEPLGLSYTSTRLKRDVLAAGPASLEVRLSSTAPQTNIWAVISDVFPDGTPHPVAGGRLSTTYPGVDRRRSLVDVRTHQVVQPYGRYDAPDRAGPGEERTYRVELWPIGNRFRAGHRIRLHILGSSGASVPGLPALNTIRVGGPDGARLMFPSLPGSNLSKALASR
jgi:predicted acyl esterase